MNISVIGTGYVGLVSGVCLASKGYNVTCVDLRPEIISQLNEGNPHIYEKGLNDLLKVAIQNKKFKASNDFIRALDNSDVIIIAVGTPSKNGEIDLGQIEQVALQIGNYIKNTNRYISVIVKSTVIPGTTDTLVLNTILKASGKDNSQFGLGMNPEFLREGDAIDDFMNPDRIVIGSEDEITKNRLTEIYKPWECDKIFVNTRTAEMIKYVNNTILATVISLNNELANLSNILGNIDYNDVIRGVISDKRWSPILTSGERITPGITTYFKPGVGFGGSCFPKDVEAIRTQGLKSGLEMPVTNATLYLNTNQVSFNLNILKDKIGDFKEKNILLLGLSFKPDTDDIRESSAIKLLRYFIDAGSQIIAHDPIAIENTNKEIQESELLQFEVEWEKFIEIADIIVIGTNWNEYRKIQSYNNSGLLINKIIFDSKRLFQISDLNQCNYITVGYSRV